MTTTPTTDGGKTLGDDLREKAEQLERIEANTTGGTGSFQQSLLSEAAGLKTAAAMADARDEKFWALVVDLREKRLWSPEDIAQAIEAVLRGDDDGQSKG